MKFFIVGGCVRDEIMGVPSNDIDFTVTLSPEELDDPRVTVNPRTPFEIMESRLVQMGFKVFESRPEFLTVRARMPKNAAGFEAGWAKFGLQGQTFDFVLARREGDYDGRRPGEVSVGTLTDDLARRDFTMNAIAKSMDGEIIDPFNGRQDINDRVIRAVGSAFERLEEDALRAVRAMRFAVTTGFRIDHELAFSMEWESILETIRSDKVADDRIRLELLKMLSKNQMDSLRIMNRFPLLTDAMLSGRVWLTPTMKER